MATSTSKPKQEKLNVKINYGGREHPFHPEARDLVGTVREQAMDFFEIVADRERLRLYRADNTELADGAEIGAYGLEKYETLILRQPQGGGT